MLQNSTRLKKVMLYYSLADLYNLQIVVGNKCHLIYARAFVKANEPLNSSVFRRP